MTSRVSTLLLFDIDGTLVQTARAGIRSMNAAFKDLHGADAALEDVPVAGRTDRAIAYDVFVKAGIMPTDERIVALREAYLSRLTDELAGTPQGPFGILPGVEPLLDDLALDADVGVGLLTGNFRGAAEVKLGHFGLWRRFAFGAFGDDHIDRRDLVPVAIGRARDAGIEVPMDRVFVIGDTPLDVDCAHAHGACAVAVATGLYDKEQLRRSGADVVLDTLEDALYAMLDESRMVRPAR